VTDKILFTLQVYFARNVFFSFPSIFRRFREENRIAELFYRSELKDQKHLQATQKRVRTCKDYVIGREITIVLKIVVNNVNC